jgi:hypothetical protein
MATQYTIYLVNQNINPQLFWAFLSAPVVSNNPQVFANSNTNLLIPGASPDLNNFTIPVQYVIGAGASNNAVGLNIEIRSTATRNANLEQLWQVAYATTPPNSGPTVPLTPTGESPPSTLAVRTNAFNQPLNQTNGWYENMSFGVKTAQGFMGVTWLPDPSKTYTITPKLNFYITVGDYSSYSLADINSVANSSAALNTSTDFDLNNICTVVYSGKGEWSHFKGRPTPTVLSAARAQNPLFLPEGGGTALSGSSAIMQFPANSHFTNVRVSDPQNGGYVLLTGGTGTTSEDGRVFSCGTFPENDRPEVGQNYTIAATEDQTHTVYNDTLECTHKGATSDFK